jgi:hypothetical protein
MISKTTPVESVFSGISVISEGIASDQISGLKK